VIKVGAVGVDILEEIRAEASAVGVEVQAVPEEGVVEIWCDAGPKHHAGAGSAGGRQVWVRLVEEGVSHEAAKAAVSSAPHSCDVVLMVLGHVPSVAALRGALAFRSVQLQCLPPSAAARWVVKVAGACHMRPKKKLPHKFARKPDGCRVPAKEAGVDVLWTAQLLQLGMPEAAAKLVVGLYGTPGKLVTAIRAGLEPEFLEDLRYAVKGKVTGSSQRIGPAMSEKVHRFYS